MKARLTLRGTTRRYEYEREFGRLVVGDRVPVTCGLSYPVVHVREGAFSSRATVCPLYCRDADVGRYQVELQMQGWRIVEGK